jgi:hypothetical protein
MPTALLIEQMLVRDPKLGRQPGPEGRIRFGKDLAVAAATVTRATVRSVPQ